AHSGAIKAFMNAAPQTTHMCLSSHTTIRASNMFLSTLTSWSVTGIIDLSDAAIVHAAYDIGLIRRDLGPVALDTATSSYRTHVTQVAPLGERAAFMHCHRGSGIRRADWPNRPCRRKYCHNGMAIPRVTGHAGGATTPTRPFHSTTDSEWSRARVIC